MGLDGHEKRQIHCKRCGLDLDPRCSRYAFLLLGFRGHDAGLAPEEIRLTLCGPCGRELREDLLLYQAGVDLSQYQQKGVVHCGRAFGSSRGTESGA